MPNWRLLRRAVRTAESCRDDLSRDTDLWRQVLHHTCRIAECHGVRWNISRHHGVGADYGPTSDANAIENGGATADPRAILNHNSTTGYALLDDRSAVSVKL